MDKARIIEATIKTKGYVVLNGCGKCMTPLLLSDDSFMLVRSEQYKEGEIVAIHAKNDPEIRLHRLIKKGCNFVITKGDHTKYYENTSVESIIGKLASFRPAGKTEYISYDVSAFNSKMLAVLSYVTRDRYHVKYVFGATFLKFILKAFRFYASRTRKRLLKDSASAFSLKD